MYCYRKLNQNRPLWGAHVWQLGGAKRRETELQGIVALVCQRFIVTLYFGGGPPHVPAGGKSRGRRGEPARAHGPTGLAYCMPAPLLLRWHLCPDAVQDKDQMSSLIRSGVRLTVCSAWHIIHTHSQDRHWHILHMAKSYFFFSFSFSPFLSHPVRHSEKMTGFTGSSYLHLVLPSRFFFSLFK